MAEMEYADIAFDYSGSRDIEELMRCARALFSITAGTLPMDREFGISAEYMDRPMGVAKSFYIAEAMTKAEKYLPECEVKDISFSYDGRSGKMKPSITLSVKEE